jgi:glycosyltransferase involved in cell wall biosynthesis
MNAPVVSVCMPAYRAELFLTATLESLRAQTFADWELIVCEDASRDGTEAILRAFAEAGPQPVRYLRHEQSLGPSTGRNRAMAEARGEWLALLDSDDLWAPDHLASLLSCAARTPAAALVYAGCVLFDHDTGRDLKLYAPTPAQVASHPTSLFLGAYNIQPSATMIRADLFKTAGGFDPGFRYAEDLELWLRYARAGTVFAYTNALTCRYRKHAGGFSRHIDRMALAMARIADQAIGWTLLPPELIRRHAAEAWLSAGRIILRSNPRTARGYFARSLMHRPWSLRGLGYWLIATLLGPLEK